MKLGLVWKRRSLTRFAVSRGGEEVAEVVQEMTPEGPRWFAKVRPMGALCTPTGCMTFKEAADALIRSAAEGDF